MLRAACGPGPAGGWHGQEGTGPLHTPRQPHVNSLLGRHDLLAAETEVRRLGSGGECGGNYNPAGKRHCGLEGLQQCCGGVTGAQSSVDLTP